MSKIVLTLNAGSSSLKFAAFTVVNGGEPSQLASGQIEGIGATAKGSVKAAAGEEAELAFDPKLGRVDHYAAMAPFSPGCARRATTVRWWRSGIASCMAARISSSRF